MRLDPADTHVALEYAFLCYETRQQAEARRTFDRLRQTGDPTAEQAFQNIDRPLAEGIARWTQALATRPRQLQRPSGTRYSRRTARRIRPRRRPLPRGLPPPPGPPRIPARPRPRLDELKDTPRSLHARSSPPPAAPIRASPSRPANSCPPAIPYVYEFEQALQLDPANLDLRRELAYLLLEMEQQRTRRTGVPEAPRTRPGRPALRRPTRLPAPEPQRSHRRPTPARPGAPRRRRRTGRPRPHRPQAAPDPPPLRRDAPRAGLNRSQNPGREEPQSRLPERRRQVPHHRPRVRPRRLRRHAEAGLGLQHPAPGRRRRALVQPRPPESRPRHRRRSRHAYATCAPPSRASAPPPGLSPFFSSRWNDAFGYGQVKTEFRLGQPPIRPYLSIRFVGDAQHSDSDARPRPAVPVRELLHLRRRYRYRSLAWPHRLVRGRRSHQVSAQPRPTSAP